MHSNIFRALAFLALPLAASCSAVSGPGPTPGTQFDPLNARPENIAVAIGVPETFQLRTGDANLRMSFKGRGAAQAIRLEETVALRILPNAPGKPAGNAGERVYIARVSAGDLDRLARVQAAILDVQATGAKGTGTLSVEVSGGCFVGPVPDTLSVSSWLQTDPLDGFVRLTSAADVFAAFDQHTVTMLRDNFTPC